MAQAFDFTVISVTLNNLAGLQATHASLNVQTHRNFEWLVIDGGSADGTQEWLAGTSAIWTSEPDAGIYDAMNKGLIRAQGRYLIFLNAGDTLATETTLEKLAIFINEYQEPDFIYGNSLERAENGELAFKPARGHGKILLGMFTHHQAMIYNRKIIGDLRYDLNYKIASDFDFTCRFLHQSHKCLRIPLPVCIFQSGGVSQQKATLGRNEQAQIRETLGIGNKFTNALLIVAQTLTWQFRTWLPNLYWHLKSSGNR